MSEQVKPEDMEALYKAQRELIDQLTLIVGNLCIIELMAKNGAPIFIYDGVKIDLSPQIIATALQVNAKDFFIIEYGKAKGIEMAYTVIKSMYLEDNGKPIELTTWGREALEILFIDAIDACKVMTSATLH